MPTRRRRVDRRRWGALEREHGGRGDEGSTASGAQPPIHVDRLGAAQLAHRVGKTIADGDIDPFDTDCAVALFGDDHGESRASSVTHGWAPDEPDQED
jgi:hypothetical protein